MKTLARTMPQPSPNRAAPRGLLSCPPSVDSRVPSWCALFCAPVFAVSRLLAISIIAHALCLNDARRAHGLADCFAVEAPRACGVKVIGLRPDDRSMCCLVH